MFKQFFFIAKKQLKKEVCPRINANKRESKKLTTNNLQLPTATANCQLPTATANCQLPTASVSVQPEHWQKYHRISESHLSRHPSNSIYQLLSAQ